MKMKTIMLALAGSLILSSCHAQAVREDKGLFAESDEKSSMPGKPDVRINVNKEYDDKGNVIRFDSTYTYFFSNPGNRKDMNNDSVLKPYTNLLNLPKSRLLFNDFLYLIRSL